MGLYSVSALQLRHQMNVLLHIFYFGGSNKVKLVVFASDTVLLGTLKACHYIGMVRFIVICIITVFCYHCTCVIFYDTCVILARYVKD